VAKKVRDKELVFFVIEGRRLELKKVISQVQVHVERVNND